MNPDRRAANTPLALAALAGPSAWPLLGNLPQLDLPHLHAQLERWAAAHGPLYRLRLGRRQVLVLAQPELIAGVLRARPEGWRRLQTMQAAIVEIGGRGLFAAEGDDWRVQRRLVMKAFDPAHLKDYFPSLLRVTARLRECLDEAARSGRPVDLQTLLMRYTVDVTAGLAFGIDMNTQQHPDDALQGHLDKVFPMLMKRIFAPFPWWRHFRLPSDRAFDRHLARVLEAIAGFIRDARERMANDPELPQRPTNLLEALIAARDDEGTGLSEEHLVGNVLTVLLAGEDTTANTLCWTLHLLHTHRGEWDAVVQAVDAAFGEHALPRDFEQARGLDVVEDCVNEAMRLHPVAPLLMFECNADTVLGGVALPRGSVVACLTRPGAVDATRVEDAAAFRPGRWREATSSASARPAGADDPARALLKASIPFGAGPRLCPGRYLAMLEMKMVIAALARNFELVDVRTGDGSPPEERLAFAMSPVGLKFRLKPRPPGPARQPASR
jgi:cytochrome P450